ncbi:MAG TPA: DNA polymerase III subunit delta [Tepidisphaeraceae bacterium]|nr:DNA polymerase III subunit delta [Tepidisphaeraceae bacterium]
MLKPVYALVGSDPFLQLQKLREIAAQLPPDAQRMDFDGETAQLGDILDELQSYAMFGGGTKLVTVRESDALITRYREQLEDYVNKPSSSATLVLRLSSLPATQRIAKAIAKVGAIESCSPPKDLVRWAIDHAKRAHQIALMPDAAKVLADYVGADLGRIDTELAKLAIQCDAGKVSLDTVCANVAFTRERAMWDLTNALAAGNVGEAISRWRQLLAADPSTEFRAVTWLGIWLSDVATIVTTGQRSSASQKLRWKYKDSFDRFARNAEALGRSGYSTALDLLTEIDKQSKSGVGDAAENVERFILTVAPMASSSRTG